MGVGEHLDLDVPGPVDEALEEQGVVAEGRRASRRAAAIAAGSSSGSSTRRMPLPPPPADGLSSTGKPMLPAAATRSVVGQPGEMEPGDDRHAAPRPVCLARILSPIVSIAAGGRTDEDEAGRAQARAKSAFSERNP